MTESGFFLATVRFPGDGLMVSSLWGVMCSLPASLPDANAECHSGTMSALSRMDLNYPGTGQLFRKWKN